MVDIESHVYSYAERNKSDKDNTDAYQLSHNMML